MIGKPLFYPVELKKELDKDFRNAKKDISKLEEISNDYPNYNISLYVETLKDMSSKTPSKCIDEYTKNINELKEQIEDVYSTIQEVEENITDYRKLED